MRRVKTHFTRWPIDAPMMHRRTGAFYQHWCNANRDLELEMLRFVDTAGQQVHIICVFFVFIANVSISISFERLHFRFYNISVFKITIISVSVNVGSVISVSVIVSVTEISLQSTQIYTHVHRI